MAAITESHISELVDLTEEGTPLEKQASLLLLTALGPKRLPAGFEARLAPTLKRLAHDHFPKDDLGSIAFAMLRAYDPNEAQRMLLNVDYSAFSDDQLLPVVTYLEMLGSAEALSRLESLGTTSTRARAAFERQVGLAGAQLRALAAEWRASHRSNTLSELYWKHIARLPHGSPIGDVLSLLGEPDSSDGQTYFYQATDSTASLLLQQDADGRIVISKLSD